MPFSDRVLDEAKRRGRVAQAFVDAFDSPEKFGGTPKAKKPEKAKGKPAVRTPLIGRVKRVAHQAANVMFPRTESASFHDRVLHEAQKKQKKQKKSSFAGKVADKVIKAADTADEYINVYRSDHPLNRVIKFAERHAGRDKGGKEKEEPKRGAGPESFGGGKTTRQAAPAQSGAAQTLQQVQWDRERSLADRSQRLAATNRRAQVAAQSTQLGGAQRGSGPAR